MRSHFERINFLNDKVYQGVYINFPIGNKNIDI
nr:MAG TPA: hypothetical protein [Caudoviricetes sp.]